MARIRPRERAAIIQSLRSGVTPRIGLEHIQVGRSREVKALIEDLDRIADGGSAFRLIIGDFGAGKSFFLQLVRYIALEKNLVVANADLAPDRRLHASGSQARNLYQELTHNLSTRAHPEGNAMQPLVERFITEHRQRAEREGREASALIEESLDSLCELVDGYDFAKVVSCYWKGFCEDRADLRSAAVRWLRGEYSTRSEAREDLGVRTIVDDANVYDHLKLLGRFCALSGCQGLLVNLDEMVNLYKLPSTRSRNANYEQILRILNDCLQGSAGHLGFLLGGTPEFLADERKGLYSYEALHSRLSENSFAQVANVVDYHSPILVLQNLSPEEMFVLLSNIRNVFALGRREGYLLPDEALAAFLRHCNDTVGEAYFKTPRNTVKAFVDLLSVLEQNPNLKWESLIGSVGIEKEEPPSLVTLGTGDNTHGGDDELTSFTL
ncbi:MAG: ATP-binding protein [Succinivibrionaceae bacterium]|nr:ATP-binding protein [Succinivibrionaceae bacterium]